MLPTSRTYLLKGGSSEHQATVLQLCLFYFGIIALRLFAKLIEFVGLGHQHSRNTEDERTHQAIGRSAIRSVQQYTDEDDITPSPHDIDTIGLAASQSLVQSVRIDTESAQSLRETNETCKSSGSSQQVQNSFKDVELASRSDLGHEQASFSCNKSSLAESHRDEHESGQSDSSPRWLESSQHSSHSRRSSLDFFEDSQEASFLKIGLQSSIAIALHKIPEGFIIFSANRVDATLGLATFVSLFIHNLMEGFTMSLSLYMALRSRFKAVLWASLIGCGSQPLGAAMAIVWFQAVGDAREDLYGGLFAVTAGVMISLAFSLFSEALVLTLRSEWCSWFVFLGMAVLSSTFAWTTN